VTAVDRATEKLKALREFLLVQTPLLIAYSGGVDSSFLLAVAAETIGAKCLGVIADSPSLPRQSLQDAIDLALSIGARIEIIPTSELSDPNYASNPINRCYFCKAELFQKLRGIAVDRGFRAIAYGENADDAHQVRPGRDAADRFGVVAPLKEVGLTKSEIRELSRALRLTTAETPAQPCLSSRIPHGTPVTKTALAMIERAETIVRNFGFQVFRVRHHPLDGRPRARLEISPGEMSRLEGIVESLCDALRDVGYTEVTIDERGYRAPAELA
jgi:pyridinium-3,5-biscarboxylic acid mononucleotide sulfurtransferase